MFVDEPLICLSFIRLTAEEMRTLLHPLFVFYFFFLFFRTFRVLVFGQRIWLELVFYILGFLLGSWTFEEGEKWLAEVFLVLYFFESLHYQSHLETYFGLRVSLDALSSLVHLLYLYRSGASFILLSRRLIRLFTKIKRAPGLDQIGRSALLRSFITDKSFNFLNGLNSALNLLLFSLIWHAEFLDTLMSHCLLRTLRGALLEWLYFFQLVLFQGFLVCVEQRLASRTLQSLLFFLCT